MNLRISHRARLLIEMETHLVVSIAKCDLKIPCLLRVRMPPRLIKKSRALRDRKHFIDVTAESRAVGIGVNPVSTRKQMLALQAGILLTVAIEPRLGGQSF